MLVPPERIELSTPPLPRVCSTSEPWRRLLSLDHLKKDFLTKPNNKILAQMTECLQDVS